MGNWRTVTIHGTIAPTDLPAAQRFVNTGDNWDRFHPLCNYGISLCGLGDWMRGDTISAVGNLSERDYSVEDVADTLRQIVAVAPSLTLKVHCGGENESTGCIATITVANGQVTTGPAEVTTVGEGISERGALRMMQILMGGGARS